MADFLQAYEKTMLLEGGYKLTDIKSDRGGQTYAGISRKFHPNWQGWFYIDKGETPPSEMVRGFYKIEFWDKFQADSITDQKVAESLYDFGVNAGVKTSAKLAQIICGVTPDGAFGPKSLQAVNSIDAQTFVLSFAIAKVSRYAAIVTKDKSQLKFLLGWLNRTLKGLK